MDAQVLEHLMQPKNYGPLENAQGEGIGKNPDNGEKVGLYFTPEAGRIAQISFQAVGCSTTVVSGSIFTEAAKGQSLEELQRMIDHLKATLDELDPKEAACSEMVAVAAQAALDTYYARQEESDLPMKTYYISQTCETKEEV